MLAYVILCLVVVQRLAELVYANHNTRALLARGGVEIGARHYPLIVALHAVWLIAIFVALPQPPVVQMAWLILFVILQALRLLVLATLGPYWTTRIITLPNAPLVRLGPYRFLTHPNYCVVAGEIFVLPMVFGEWQIALIFSVLNATVLSLRIREENRALAARRSAD